MQARLLRVDQEFKAFAGATIIVWQTTVKNYNRTMSRKHQMLTGNRGYRNISVLHRGRMKLFLNKRTSLMCTDHLCNDGMDNPSSSTVLRQRFHQLGCGFSAVQRIHAYGSVPGGAGGDGEQRESQGPMTIRG